MWSGRDSEITTLENARIHEPIQSHEAPTSMGNVSVIASSFCTLLKLYLRND